MVRFMEMLDSSPVVPNLGGRRHLCRIRHLQDVQILSACLRHNIYRVKHSESADRRKQEHTAVQIEIQL